MIRLFRPVAAGALRATALIGWSFVARIATGQEVVDRIERQVATVETRQARGQLSRPQELALKVQLDSVAPELASYLRGHPDDVRALVLSARLGLLRIGFGTQIIDLSHPAERADEYAPLQAAVDHALALQPTDADVNWWKGRLYAVERTFVRNGQLVHRFERDSAIWYARRAVALAPENRFYREALAMFVFARDGPDSALSVLRIARGTQDPVYPVLEQLAAVPVPPGAMFSWLWTTSIGMMEVADLTEAGAIPEMADYPQVRIAGFVIPTTLTELQTFYHKRWPGFEFFPAERERAALGGGMGSLVFEQGFRTSGRTLTPAATPSDVPKFGASGLALQAFVFDLAECRRRHCVMLDDSAFAAAVSSKQVPADSAALLLIFNFERRDTH